MLTSIIIISYNEGQWLRKTVESFLAAKTGIPFEIIVIDDGSTDQSTVFLNSGNFKNIDLIKLPRSGVTRAKNAGANKARGEVLIFSDAHILVEDFWLEKMLEDLQEKTILSPLVVSLLEPQRVGMGLTFNNELLPCWRSYTTNSVEDVPVLPGGFMLIKKNDFIALGGYDEGLKIWGYDDCEFSLRAWLMGFNLLVTPRTKVFHLFRSGQIYKGYNENVLFNLGRLACLHFKPQRIVKVLNKVSRFPFGAKIIEDLASEQKLWQQREHYLKVRVKDDDWYFKRFGIDF
ncbi:glycosyltransferase family 2 protein [Carboxydothermus hydrogenoformans]|uniref:Glycosyl transferase, group 2 family n=1 Tax=Carboxydothermus hydrogenoformans (strain ATCC BAA-161 / DSM 6008 / Z-2901) TaxID=246194 RepID=Q3A8Y2_CARHZ|nr:glycosyltransferase [Carboxydothermus hydrogenoformans]ABB14482.1 glycosyl transferase, group 2 family [Carboxydothermus hydrogenoformans Z-2901]